MLAQRQTDGSSGIGGHGAVGLMCKVPAGLEILPLQGWRLRLQRPKDSRGPQWWQAR